MGHEEKFFGGTAGAAGITRNFQGPNPKEKQLLFGEK